MGKVYPQITGELKIWIEKQKLFFVATAPLSPDGHINCSPKGADTFCVIDASTVAYMDLTGSGIETVAHLKDNGRIVIMFCAFEGPPQILRLHGQGEVLTNGPEFDKLKNLFTEKPGARCLIKIAVSRVSTSCGFAVPLFQYQNDRNLLEQWAAKKGPAGLKEYRQQNNRQSIDALTGLTE